MKNGKDIYFINKSDYESLNMIRELFLGQDSNENN